MAAQPLMSVEGYLTTSFEDGDCGYIDGTLEETNTGEADHGSVKALVATWLYNRRK